MPFIVSAEQIADDVVRTTWSEPIDLEFNNPASWGLDGSETNVIDTNQNGAAIVDVTADSPKPYTTLSYFATVPCVKADPAGTAAEPQLDVPVDPGP